MNTAQTDCACVRNGGLLECSFTKFLTLYIVGWYFLKYLCFSQQSYLWKYKRIWGKKKLWRGVIYKLSSRGSVYPKMRQMQPFEADIFKSMPPDHRNRQGSPATQNHFNWAVSALDSRIRRVKHKLKLGQPPFIETKRELLRSDLLLRVWEWVQLLRM